MDADEEKALRAANAHELTVLVEKWIASDKSNNTHINLAKHIGVSRFTLRNYLNGTTDIPSVKEKKLKALCGDGNIAASAKKTLESWRDWLLGKDKVEE